MKKSFLTAIACTVFIHSFSQNTFPSSGNAGVGTTSPADLLHIAGSSGNLGIRLANGNASTDYNSLRFYHGGTEKGSIYTNQGNMFINPYNGNLFLASAGTNVGVGSSAIYEKFQVGSKFTFHDGGYKKICYNSWYDPNASTIKRIESGPIAEFVFTNNGEIILATGPTGNANTNVDNYVYAFIVKNDGKIGIGTVNPQAQLAVNGDIFSKKMKVTQTGWPDYVFNTDYPLRPLPELEMYIRQQHHLPDVPSAAAIEKDGIDLGDNQAILLKKIEELTLYLIEQNKKLGALEKRVLQFMKGK